MKKYYHGVEIGAGDSYSSQLLKRENEFEFLSLYEPNNELFSNLLFSFPSDNEFLRRVYAYNVAIGDSKSNELFNFGYCSYIRGGDSFIKLSCEENAESFWLPLKTICKVINIKEIDDGKIDYLVLTSNGSEMNVLNDMISRPEIIRTKYYCHNAAHWSYYNQITNWMNNNGYGYGIILDRSDYGTYFHIEFRKK